MGRKDARAVDVARYLSANHLLFLTLAMASARTLTAWAAQVPESSVITMMSRNGTQFGARLSGNDHWFIAPAPMVGRALFHPGRSAADGAPDIGDSALLEACGTRRSSGCGIASRRRARRRHD